MNKQAQMLKPGDRVIKGNGRAYRVRAVCPAPVSHRAMTEPSVIVYWHARAFYSASRYALTAQIEVVS
jgi:hypothetical protein